MTQNQPATAAAYREAEHIATNLYEQRWRKLLMDYEQLLIKMHGTVEANQQELRSIQDKLVQLERRTNVKLDKLEEKTDAVHRCQNNHRGELSRLKLIVDGAGIVIAGGFTIVNGWLQHWKWWE